ncbi:MAG: beta-ketoacyl-[acyl-carrier-protein] synthase family protein [Candidatus Eremiobacteraeota bacterium]|nr:beta-ketoacyl-[acyl-carrier-protein] synthase family protein [Candidatus Eremiobacteraeota bacterium]
MADHRVVITGFGAITPLGIGKDAFWKNLCAGTVAVGEITRFDASAFPSRLAAQVESFDPNDFMERRRVHWMDRFSQFGVGAARLAVEDAKFTSAGMGEEVGVYTGSALGGLAFAEEQIGVFAERGLAAVRPLLTISVFGGAVTSNIALEFNCTGPSMSNANSCASGAVAIGDAFRAISRGDIRAALAGGIEAPLAPLSFGAFSVVRAMSTRNDDPATASRPFDRDRDGFVMAEGAGMFVLERYDDAVRRGANLYAEILGYGITNDAHHMSAPRPDGSQTAAAIERALREARLDAGAVDAVNAHGSSTKVGDRAEALAYERVFGERARTLPVSATKGQHGHALGATGAWEIGISALSMRHSCMPGTVNLYELDDECRLGLSREPIDVMPNIILANSSGFGGINAALVLAAPELR